MLFESLSLLISTLVISIQSADSIEEQSLVQRLFTYDIVWTFLLNMVTFSSKLLCTYAGILWDVTSQYL